MFNLETAVAEWRQELLAAGIKAPEPLEELESHLREEIEGQLASGLEAEAAFKLAVRQTGPATALETEFTKAGETLAEKLKQLFHRFTGVPNYQLATAMNMTAQNHEPGWASYLKTLTLILPALFLWVGACVLVVPKLKELCAASNLALPGPVVTALTVSECFKEYFILGSLVTLAVLGLLEWRSRWWPRYRRLVFGIVAYGLNFVVLILLAVVCVVAVAAGAHLLPHH